MSIPLVIYLLCMGSYLLIGSYEDSTEYLERLIKDEKIKNHNIKFFKEPIKIEEARNMRSSLSFKTTEKRLIAILAGMTIEAQNSLLKCIEELDDFTSFVIFADKEDEYLSTIKSRCLVKKFSKTKLSNGKSDLGLITYAEIDRLSFEYASDLSKLQLLFREILLDDKTPNEVKKMYFYYYKRFMKVSNLAKTNNVSEKTILEYTFLS